MNDDKARARTLYTLWGAFFASNGAYALLGYFLSQNPARTVGVISLVDTPPDPLAGLLVFLPLALPLVLLPFGLLLWQRAQATGARGDFAPRRGLLAGNPSKVSPHRLQLALIFMIAVFEANTVIGLMFFFMGAPLMKFLSFVAGTCCLMLVALQKLRAAIR